MRSILQGSLFAEPSPIGPQVPNPAYDATDIVKCLLPPTIDKPQLSPTESINFKEHTSHHVKSAYTLKKDTEWAYVTVIGQCTKELIVKLETYDEYKQISASNDVIAILDIIQQVCFNYQNDEMTIVSKFRAFMALFSMK